MTRTTVALPSGRVVTIAAERRAPLARRAGAALFSEVHDLFAQGGATLSSEGEAVDPASLELRDFHALRAVATRLGLLAEEKVTIDCGNCGEAIERAPCAGLALGPFEDRELDDPELDTTLDLAEGHPIPNVRLDGRVARTIRLAPRTAGEARPLHVALARRRLHVSPAVVSAMGVAALGDERRPDRIARALARCSESAWRAIGDLFLRAHYPPRLFAIALCPACGARNDVDAPFEREFEPGAAEDEHGEAQSAFSRESNGDVGAGGAAAEAFPSFEEFAREAREMGKAILRDHEDDVALVVEGGVPACDEGGEPLLGSYVPAAPGSETEPSRPPEITVFHRTFRAMWADDGPYDWRAELRETIEHELAHHLAHLAGDDPVDEEERRAIDEEARRIVGKKALVREGVSALAAHGARDLAGFIRRTWLVWLILAFATLLATLAASR